MPTLSCLIWRSAALKTERRSPGAIPNNRYWRQILPFMLGLSLAWQTALPLPVQAEDKTSPQQLELRVAIQERASRLRVGSSTPALVKGANGRSLGQLSSMQAFYAQRFGSRVRLGPWQDRRLWIEPQDGGYVFIGNRWYRGRTELVGSSAGILAVNRVSLEEYLYSVVGAEMPRNWPLEALKAQSVAARSYVLFQRQRNANANYDLGNSQTWQVYKGLASESLTTQQAVRETSGQVVTYNSQIIEAVYHSSSGGHTENVEDVWIETLPYLRGVPDYDVGAPVYEWSARVSQTRLRALIPGIGNVLSMTPLRTTPQGRVVLMRVAGDRGSRDIEGTRLRTLLNLRSTLFSVVPRFGPVASLSPVAAPPGEFVIYGRGFGHGLGLSQWGAHNMATQGLGYQQIMSHYYQGAALGVITVVP